MARISRKERERRFLAKDPRHRRVIVNLEQKKAKDPVFRRKVWENCGKVCCQCGAMDDLQIDHILPISRGGRTKLDNVQVLCGPCNAAKGTAIIDIGNRPKRGKSWK